MYKYKQIWLETKTIHPAGWLRWLTFGKPWDFINQPAGWWLSPTPLKNDGVRQLGSWNSQYMEKYNMFQTTNQQSKGWRMMSTKTTIHSRAESF